MFSPWQETHKSRKYYLNTELRLSSSHGSSSVCVRSKVKKDTNDDDKINMDGIKKRKKKSAHTRSNNLSKKRQHRLLL